MAERRAVNSDVLGSNPSPGAWGRKAFDTVDALSYSAGSGLPLMVVKLTDNYDPVAEAEAYLAEAASAEFALA